MQATSNSKLAHVCRDDNWCRYGVDMVDTMRSTTSFERSIEARQLVELGLWLSFGFSKSLAIIAWVLIGDNKVKEEST